MKSFLKELFGFFKRHRIFTIILCSTIFIYLCLSPFVTISWGPKNVSQNCDSIALDKYQMNSVDKIVIKTPDKDTVIVNQILVNKIIKATMVADSGSSEMPTKWECSFQLYIGSRLVRNMQQDFYFPTVMTVYKTDGHKYWCYPNSKYGTVNISEKLLTEIQKALEADGNTYKFDPS